MVCWPCLLKLDGDEELMYFADHEAFLTDCTDMILQQEDRLVDSKGNTYSIKNGTTPLVLTPTDVQFDAQKVSNLIQEHEFAKAQVCIIKIHFTSVAQAIKALAN